ncbi:MAG: invasion associated locus B family protein [Pikeienuella sp.]
MKTLKKTVAAVCSAMVIAAAGLMTTGHSASAQAREAVDRKQDWSVFKQGEAASRECWIVSQPVSSTAKRGGSTVDVNRGDIFLMVGIRPGDRVKNEVSMMGGYPFRKGSSVKVKIGSNNYELFTAGEGAWTDSGESDDKLVAAMKRGSDAIVSGISTRGTTTIDTFSLRGFTAALNEARKVCQ